MLISWAVFTRGFSDIASDWGSFSIRRRPLDRGADVFNHSHCRHDWVSDYAAYDLLPLTCVRLTGP